MWLWGRELLEIDLNVYFNASEALKEQPQKATGICVTGGKKSQSDNE